MAEGTVRSVEIEGILDHKEDEEIQYKVKWKGFEEDSWVDRKALKGPMHLADAYDAANKIQPSATETDSTSDNSSFKRLQADRKVPEGWTAEEEKSETDENTGSKEEIDELLSNQSPPKADPTVEPVMLDLTTSSPENEAAALEQATGNLTILEDDPVLVENQMKKDKELEDELKANPRDSDSDCMIVEWDKPKVWPSDDSARKLPYWRDIGFSEECFYALVRQYVRLAKAPGGKLNPEVKKNLTLEYVAREMHCTVDDVKAAMGITEAGASVPLGMPRMELPSAVQKAINEVWQCLYNFQKQTEQSCFGWDVYTTICYTMIINPNISAYKAAKIAKKLHIEQEVVDVERSSRCKKQYEKMVTQKHFLAVYTEIFSLKPRKIMNDLLYTAQMLKLERPISIMEPINKEEFEIIKELATRLSKRKGMPKPLFRGNVCDTECDSWVFGWSMKRYVKKGEKRTTQATSNHKNKNCKRIYELIKALINVRHSYFQYTSITVNRNLKCNPHRDKRNCGVSYIVAFGMFEGGELDYEISDTRQGRFDLKNHWTLFDGNQLHGNQPFKGTRFSLVYYRHSNIVKDLDSIATPEELRRRDFYKPP